MDEKKIKRTANAAATAALVAQLENTVLVEPDGTRHKLGKKP